MTAERPTPPLFPLKGDLRVQRMSQLPLASRSVPENEEALLIGTEDK
jgi:hypothetical protein